jgi:hypothetical protein
MEAAQHMQSPNKSVAAIGGIFVILVLFVALVILAAVAKLIHIGHVLGGTSSPASGRAT